MAPTFHDFTPSYLLGQYHDYFMTISGFAWLTMCRWNEPLALVFPLRDFQNTRSVWETCLTSGQRSSDDSKPSCSRMGGNSSRQVEVGPATDSW